MAPKMHQVLTSPPWNVASSSEVSLIPALCDRWLDSTREMFRSRRRLIKWKKIGRIFVCSLVDLSVYLDAAECLM